MNFVLIYKMKISTTFKRKIVIQRQEIRITVNKMYNFRVTQNSTDLKREGTLVTFATQI